jgi:pyruvate/2-oxoglutarate dehydrogenase complex dihydrolipoamide dehydrogenase (E3) component
LGSQVHLIGFEATILPGEDPQAAAIVQARLEQEGIRLHLDCQEMAVETAGNLRAVVVNQPPERKKLLVEQMLFCEPRQPNTTGLGLEAAGVGFSDGRIVVGDRLETTQRHILAAGEVCGEQFAAPQAAEATARLAVHNALSLLPRRLSRLVIPRCVYTDPAVAHVGLPFAQIEQNQVPTHSLRIDLSEAAESIAPSRRQGFIKVHLGRAGRLLAATVVAEEADELIAPLVLLMTRRGSLAALTKLVPCRPSRWELLVRLANRWGESSRGSRWTEWLERWPVLQAPAKRIFGKLSSKAEQSDDPGPIGPH